MVEWSIEAAASAQLDATYVVRGATDLPVPPLVADKVRFVRNDRWREGIATSLQAGVTQARRDGHAAVVVGLGDQPLVQSDAWRLVARATTSPVAVATYRGERGNPVRLSSHGVAAAAPRRGRRGTGGHEATPGPGGGSTVSGSCRRHRYGGRSP